MLIEPLDIGFHRMDLFACGNEKIDEILHDALRLEGCGTTYVVVAQAHSEEVIACFTLLPDVMPGKFVPGFTATLLNILAVDYRYQNQGIGKWILSQLIANIIETAESYGLDYLLVEPIDTASKDYYLHTNFGFVALEDGKVVLSVETMRQALGDITPFDPHEHYYE